MILGISCTVVVGLIALYQTWAARSYCKAALLFQEALENHKTALEAQRAVTIAVNAHLESIIVVLPLIQAAYSRGDIRTMHALLAGAVAQSDAQIPSPGGSA